MIFLQSNLSRILVFTCLFMIGQSAFAVEGSILEQYRQSGGLRLNDGESQENIEPQNQETENKRKSLPSRLATGNELTEDRIQTFNALVKQNLPMTPDMIRLFNNILLEQKRAAVGRVEPREETSTILLSLEPGEPAPLLNLSPGLASVIGFYDATGSAWPVKQYVLGDSNNFQAVHLGEESNNIVLTPNAEFGFTNLVVILDGQDKPVTIRVNITEDVADYRFDVQLLRQGPNANIGNNAVTTTRVGEQAGDSLLLSVVSGVDIPQEAKIVDVIGVDARAWLFDDDLYLRSRHALLSPGWTSSMAGVDGIRAYRIKPASFALFSVDGQIIRADLKLP